MTVTFTEELNEGSQETMNRLGFVWNGRWGLNQWQFRDDMDPQDVDLNEVYRVAVTCGGRFVVDPK